MFEDWREKLDPSTKNKLEKLLKDLKVHEDAYKSTLDSKTAQLWVALAQTYDKIDTVNRRLKRIENLLDKISKGPERKKKIKDEELRKSLNKF